MRNWKFLLLLGTACDAQPKASESVQRAAETLARPSPTFACDPRSVTTDTAVGTVAGAEGHVLVLRPSSEPCRYHLVHVDEGGVETRLSNQAGMTFLTRGLAIPAPADATRLAVCWTDLSHRHSGLRNSGATAGSNLTQRVIVGVDVVCRVRDAMRWRPPLRLTDSAKQGAAAWLDGVVPEEREPGAFRVSWTRDSTFTFLGEPTERPQTDGLYASTVVARTRKPLTSSQPVRLGPVALDVSARIE